jgi:hypothetical protein
MSAASGAGIPAAFKGRRMTPFEQVLDEILQMHDKKKQDYGRDNDPFANVRASEDFGVPGWVGCLIRANDKVKRLQKAAAGGMLANESVEDSLLDLAVYSAIALVLFRETHKPFNPLDLLKTDPEDWRALEHGSSE